MYLTENDILFMKRLAEEILLGRRVEVGYSTPVGPSQNDYLLLAKF